MATYFSYQKTDSNIINAIGTHPAPVECFICTETPISGIRLGMKYDQATESCYDIDENGDLINESAIDISNYIGI